MSDTPPNSPTDEQWKQIKDVLATGNKIEAIKLYREFTNCQLFDAKQAIDKLYEELRAADPEKYPQAQGCMRMIVLAAALIYLFS